MEGSYLVEQVESDVEAVPDDDKGESDDGRGQLGAGDLGNSTVAQWRM